MTSQGGKENSGRSAVISLIVLMFPYTIWRGLWIVGPVVGIMFFWNSVAGFFALGISMATLFLMWFVNLIYIAVRSDRALEKIDDQASVWSQLDRVFLFDRLFP